MGGKREWPGVRAGSKSSIEIDFYYKNIRCKERLKLIPSPANLKRAFNHRAAILDAIERGTFSYSVTFPESPNALQFEEYKGAGYLLRDFLSSWLEAQRKHLHSSTYFGYAKIVNNVLIPNFGDKTLSELKRADVRKWCDDQTTTNKRLSNVQSVMRCALEFALNEEPPLLETNVLKGWTYKKKEAPKSAHKIDPLDINELKLLLANCKHPQHNNLFKFACWTGLRTSELIALQWGDIDWVKNTAHIWRAITQTSTVAETPKTKAGGRYVTLLTPALEALKAQKEHSFLLPEGTVFLNPYSSKPWPGDQKIRENAWLPAIRKAGIRYRNPYQTRHTYASMMLTAGESPIWIAKQMGHSDTAMIFRNYGRWIDNKEINAGAKAVKMFDENAENILKTG